MKSTATKGMIRGKVAPCVIIESARSPCDEDRFNNITSATYYRVKAEARGFMPTNQAQSITASTTKSGNRSDIVIDAGDDMAALTLDDHGMICDCNGASEALFKYSRSELVLRHVSMLLPQLAELDVMRDGQPNPYLRFLSRIGHHFQAVTQDGEHFATELFLNLLGNKGHSRLSLIVRPSEKAAGDEGLRASGD